MAIDLEAVKRRLNKLQNSNAPSYKWRPDEDSVTTVRLVPFKHNPDYPFIELYFHYNIGRKNYLSPMSFGDPDPVVKFVDELKSTGDRDDWQTARSIEPKLRTYVPIVVRGEEEKGVRFWGFGKTVYENLLSLIGDPEYGDMTDPTSGYDIKIEYISKEKASGNFPETKIRAARKNSKLTDDPNLMKKLLEDQPTLEEVFEREWTDYDELDTAFKKFLSGEVDDDTPAPKATSNSDDDDDTELPWDDNSSGESGSGLDDELEGQLSGLFDDD